MARRDKVIWCDRGWLPIYFGFCPSETAWHLSLKLLGAEAAPYPSSDGKCSLLQNKSGDLCIIVTLSDAIDKKRDFPGIAGLIVHEAMHVWRAMCEHLGEGRPSSEFEAYAMQAISGQLIDAYIKTRRPKLKF